MDIFEKALEEMRSDIKLELNDLRDTYSISGMIAREKLLQIETVMNIYKNYKEGGRT